MTKDEKVLAEISSQDYFDKKEYENLWIEADRAKAHSDYRLQDEILQKIIEFFKRRSEYFKNKTKGVKLKAVFDLVDKLRKEDEFRKKEIRHSFDELAV